MSENIRSVGGVIAVVVIAVVIVFTLLGRLDTAIIAGCLVGLAVARLL